MLFEEITLGELKPLKRAFNRRQPTPKNQSGEPAATTTCCCHPLLFAASLAVQAVVGVGMELGRHMARKKKRKEKKKKEQMVTKKKEDKVMLEKMGRPCEERRRNEKRRKVDRDNTTFGP